MTRSRQAHAVDRDLVPQTLVSLEQSLRASFDEEVMAVYEDTHRSPHWGDIIPVVPQLSGHLTWSSQACLERRLDDVVHSAVGYQSDLAAACLVDRVFEKEADRNCAKKRPRPSHMSV